jgi:putative DNA primase/helicase
MAGLARATTERRRMPKKKTEPPSPPNSPEAAAILEAPPSPEHELELARWEAGEIERLPPPPEKLPPTSAGMHVQNDTGNANRLIDLFGANLRYCEGLGWLRWDGKRWAAGDGPWRETEACAKLVGDEGKRIGGDIGAAMEKWGRMSGNASRITACIELASHRPNVRIEPDVLDADPWLFNAANGIVDLRTGELRAHRREDYCTKIAGVAYDPAAECPRFAAFLTECMGDDLELVGYLLRWLGYCLTADTREHCFGLWHGPSGRNGKSVLLNVMLHVLGDYGTTLAPGVLLASKHQEHTTGLLDLRGVRFAASNEVPEGQRFNESIVKQLTGGDMIKARAMRQDFVSFAPTHKLVLACNARPLVREHGPAFWSRVAEVPWSVSFRGREDRELFAKLKAEAPGILRYLVAGCMAWQRDGLAPPSRMVEATTEYRASQDVVGAFLEDECELEANSSAPKSQLFSAYKSWAIEAGEFVHGKHAFNRILAERGYQCVKPKGSGEVWLGLRLKRRGLAAVTGAA